MKWNRLFIWKSVYIRISLHFMLCIASYHITPQCKWYWLVVWRLNTCTCNNQITKQPTAKITQATHCLILDTQPLLYWGLICIQPVTQHLVHFAHSKSQTNGPIWQDGLKGGTGWSRNTLKCREWHSILEHKWFLKLNEGFSNRDIEPTTEHSGEDSNIKVHDLTQRDTLGKDLKQRSG